MFNVEFCEKQMKAVGITKTALAEKCGVSTNHIIQVTLGNKNPSVKLVTQMAKVLGCKSTDLWSIEDKLYQKPYEKDVDEETVDKYDEKVYSKREMVESIDSAVALTMEKCKKDGVYLDTAEAKVLLDWFEADGLFDLIENKHHERSMEWLSKMMCIYAKCKEVA